MRPDLPLIAKEYSLSIDVYSQKIGLTGQFASVFLRLTNEAAMETKNIEKQDPFERASNWITSFLVPVFESLARELEEMGYHASVPRHIDQSLTLRFDKGANRFEYRLECMIGPPSIPDRPEDYIALECSRRVNYTAEPVPFRETRATYDIKGVSEQEIKQHFRNTFRRWLEEVQR
jgi:hypothetical protein